jgi:hypothetical protein
MSRLPSREGTQRSGPIAVTGTSPLVDKTHSHMCTCPSVAILTARTTIRTGSHIRLPIQAVISRVPFWNARSARAPWPGRCPGLAGPARVPQATDVRSGPSVVRCACVSLLTSPGPLIVHGPGPVEASHLADHRFLPRTPSPGSGGGKTDCRSNFDKPSIGLSIEFGGGGSREADEQEGDHQHPEVLRLLEAGDRLITPAPPLYRPRPPKVTGRFCAQDESARNAGGTPGCGTADGAARRTLGTQTGSPPVPAGRGCRHPACGAPAEREA